MLAVAAVRHCDTTSGGGLKVEGVFAVVVVVSPHRRMASRSASRRQRPRVVHQRARVVVQVQALAPTPVVADGV